MATEATPAAARSPSLPTLCIINYNGVAHLPRTLAAAVAQETDFVEILLIDNGSADASVTLTRRDFPTVRIVEVGENRGAGGARNVGLDEARSDLMLFIDNDVSITAGCAGILRQALEDHPGAAIAMPTVVYARADDTVQYDGADSHYLGLMILTNENTPRGGLDATVRKRNSLVSCAFMIDRAMLQGKVRFDEDYFPYLVEDHDFGVRVRTLGFEILTVPRAEVIHGDGNEALSLRHLGTYGPTRIFCTIRGRWLFLLKHYSLRSLILLLPMLLVYEAAQGVIVVKKGWVGHWLRAAGWIIRHFPQIMAKRREIQRARKLPDSSVLQGGPIPLREELVTSSLERAAHRLLDTIVIGYWKGVGHLIA